MMISQKKMLQIAATLIIVTTIGHLLGFVFAVPEHLLDPTWPDHARFHALQALLGVIGIDLAIIVITLGPFLQHAQKGSLWLLAVMLLFAQGNYFIAAIFLPEGITPGILVNIVFALSIFLWVVGLIVGYRAIYR